MEMPVIDPFDAAADPALPSLVPALNPGEARRQLASRLFRWMGERGTLHLRAIRVVRHKPGRRCVVEYDVEVERPDLPPEAVTLIGKVRVRRFGKSGYRLLRSLWEAGFGADSADGISVPEPVGHVPAFQMWLQRKVSGRPATELLPKPVGVTLARQIAEAAHKVHRTSVPAERRHTMADELRILHERLPAVAQAHPPWQDRIARLLDACDRLGAATPAPVPRGIHRDFYADQVIVAATTDDGRPTTDNRRPTKVPASASHPLHPTPYSLHPDFVGRRLHLIDFDLYCEGDPALDIGNFIGHIREQSLRTLGDPAALADREEAMEERFVALSGEATRAAVRAYAALTLVRHIHLSTLFPERRPFTGHLLELCEERLALATSGHAPRVECRAEEAEPFLSAAAW